MLIKRIVDLAGKVWEFFIPETERERRELSNANTAVGQGEGDPESAFDDDYVDD